MSEDNEFWDFYWEMRLAPMENLGKREAILAASKLIRGHSKNVGRPLHVVELGCGEGQVIGTLLNSHAQLCDTEQIVGLDYNAKSLAKCRHDYPGLRFLEGDITDKRLLVQFDSVDILLLVNTLHEIFSAGYSSDLGEVDIVPAKQQVQAAFGAWVQTLAPQGWVVLFDGLEPPGNPQEKMRIRFLDHQALSDFKVFAAQYQPFRIVYQEIGPFKIELTRHDFTRYITKSIFLGKALWNSEQKESYQYFTQQEFEAMFASQGLKIIELRTLTMNEEKWRRLVEIETLQEIFPEEHIMILAQRCQI